jgi:hypothetical protein
LIFCNDLSVELIAHFLEAFQHLTGIHIDVIVVCKRSRADRLPVSA